MDHIDQILYNDTDQNSVNNCLSDYGYINFVCKSISPEPNEEKYFAQQIFLFQHNGLPCQCT